MPLSLSLPRCLSLFLATPRPAKPFNDPAKVRILFRTISAFSSLPHTPSKTTLSAHSHLVRVSSEHESPLKSHPPLPTHSYPELVAPLVTERDLYLAWSLKRSKAVNGASRVVGVVGRGHMRGVVYALLRDQGGAGLRWVGGRSGVKGCGRGLAKGRSGVVFRASG